MKRIIIGLALGCLVSGCASWTPEQRAQFGANLRASLAAQQQANQQALAQQMQATASWGQPRPQVFCNTSYVGNYAYTHCQ